MTNKPSPRGKKRVVKGWFTDLGFKGRMFMFSGEAFEFRARIYPTKALASAEWDSGVTIVPCTISYTLPPKKGSK